MLRKDSRGRAGGEKMEIAFPSLEYMYLTVSAVHTSTIRMKTERKQTECRYIYFYSIFAEVEKNLKKIQKWMRN
jgi:hypothetical protein